MQTIEQIFTERFKKKPLIVAAPGRVNLIGEHTDYNEGFVLPGAVDKRMYVAIARQEGDTVEIFARQYNDQRSFPIDHIEPDSTWLTYLKGVYHFISQKSPLGGLAVVIDGDVPVGAGMSSSAALCSAFGLALNELFDLGLSRMELALIGQQTEHQFAGVKCGIMDQFASLHGKKGSVIKLDCRSLEYEYIPFDFPDYKIVLVNSMVSHSLAGSEYNVRRKQCEEGVALLKKYYPEISSLRGVSSAQLKEHQDDFPPDVFQRCLYVTSENERLVEACKALREGDLCRFGNFMFATHDGLSRMYGVSCAELDFLVEKAKTIEGVVGSRMMGGGFGGCTINIVQADKVDSFTTQVQKAYADLFGKTADVYVTQIEDGAKRIN